MKTSRPNLVRGLEALEDRRLLSISQTGSEFRVNNFTTGDQWSPAVAADLAGNYVVVWQSQTQDSGTPGIYAQRDNSAGATQGGEFKVNTFTTGTQADPSVAMDADGDFVVAWSSQNQDGGGYGVYVQRDNAAGAAQGTELRVNTYTTGNQAAPSVAMDFAGNFVVAWHSSSQDGSGLGVYAQRFSAAGSPLGGELLVNNSFLGSQHDPSVAMDAGGNFNVAWRGAPPTGGYYLCPAL